ncbi:hypothetical protein [Caulobacter sp. 1776]|uniref:hypothetical protein n=1 Tax=Caulobacter sp. 1776 TaxID=3156420 RepID=UPI0033946177
MTQTTAPTWCERLQAKLMDAIDAAWKTIDTSDDPVLIRKARDKAKACGEMAANARRIAAMVVVRKPLRAGAALAAPFAPEASESEDRPARALDRLKGGGRGRL